MPLAQTLFYPASRPLPDIQADQRQIREALKALPNDYEVQAAKARYAAKTTELALSRIAPEEVEEAHRALLAVQAEKAKTPALTDKLRALDEELSQCMANDRKASASSIKKQHAEAYAQYKRDCQRLLDDLKALIALEAEYRTLAGGTTEIGTPGWSQGRERELNLPAISHPGDIGATARYI